MRLLPRLRSYATVVIIALCAACVNDAMAQGAMEAIVTVPRANVRLKPADNAAVIESVSVGVVLDVLAEEGTWLRVSLPPAPGGLPRVGYIAARLVEKQAKASASPAPSPGTAAAPVVTPDEKAASATPSASQAEPAVESHEELLKRAEDILQASVHGGYAPNPSYWRQIAKVTKALEYRMDQRYNLISPIIQDELKLQDRVVPPVTKDPIADIAGYRSLASGAIAHIEVGGRVIDWQQTLAGVEPEKGFVKRFAKRAVTIGVYAVNPLAGAVVGTAGRAASGR